MIETRQEFNYQFRLFVKKFRFPLTKLFYYYVKTPPEADPNRRGSWVRPLFLTYIREKNTLLGTFVAIYIPSLCPFPVLLLLHTKHVSPVRPRVDETPVFEEKCPTLQGPVSQCSQVPIVRNHISPLTVYYTY